MIFKIAADHCDVDDNATYSNYYYKKKVPISLARTRTHKHPYIYMCFCVCCFDALISIYIYSEIFR